MARCSSTGWRRMSWRKWLTAESFPSQAGRPRKSIWESSCGRLCCRVATTIVATRGGISDDKRQDEKQDKRWFIAHAVLKPFGPRNCENQERHKRSRNKDQQVGPSAPF